MAENPLSIMDPIANFFASENISYAASLFANLVISTIIGGLILAVIVKIIGKEWGENVSALNAFALVLIINLINIFGIVGIIGTYIAFIPYMLLILPLIIWIALVKLFFGEMTNLHIVIVAVIGYAVSIFLVPYMVAMLLPLIPV